MGTETWTVILTAAAMGGGVIGWLLNEWRRRAEKRKADEAEKTEAKNREKDQGLHADRNAGIDRIAANVQSTGGVELDILPFVQYASIVTRDPAERFVIAEITNTGNRPARVRDVYIETADRQPLQACWTNGEMADMALDMPTCFTLAAGKKCTVYFAIREQDGMGLPHLVAPDYGVVPWCAMETALHVVVQCVGSKHQSHANGAIKNFRDWVKRYRNNGGRRATREAAIRN